MTEKEPVNNITISKLTNKLQTSATSFDCTSKYIWRYLWVVNLFGALNSDLHKLPYSNSVNVNNQKVQSVCRSSFDYLPQVYLWFWLWQYHLSSKQTVKCKCITLYDYTVYCTIRNIVQSVIRQHRKRTLEKSEMVTYKDTA